MRVSPHDSKSLEFHGPIGHVNIGDTHHHHCGHGDGDEQAAAKYDLPPDTEMIDQGEYQSVEFGKV